MHNYNAVVEREHRRTPQSARKGNDGSGIVRNITNSRQCLGEQGGERSFMQWYSWLKGSGAGESALSQWSLVVHRWAEGRGESDSTVRRRADGVGFCIWTLPWRQWGTHEELWNFSGVPSGRPVRSWSEGSLCYMNLNQHCGQGPEWVLRVDHMCLMCGKSCLQESLGRNPGEEKKIAVSLWT